MKWLLPLLLAAPLVGQVPTPQVPLTGNIGSGGLFPIDNTGTISFSSDANRTMAYPEMTAKTFQVLSAVPLTTTRNLMAPNGRGWWFIVENMTTGAQAIQVIGTTGTGVLVANGYSQLVWNDGTNYVAVGAAAANAVLLAPTSNQTVTSTNSNLTLNNTMSQNGQTFVMNPTANFNGWNLGQGIAANYGGESDNCVFSVQGIKHCYSGLMTSYGSGDGSNRYTYSGYYGNAEDASAEGVGPVDQSHQLGVMSATVTTSPAAGATSIVTTGIHCTLAGNGCASPIGYSQLQFPQGGLLLDSSQPGSTLTLQTQNAFGATTLNGMSYTFTGTAPTVSSAYGNITSCTAASGSPSPTGTSPQPVSCTVNVLSTGGFTVGHTIYYAGAFRDASVVTAVSGSVPTQTITFNTVGTLGFFSTNYPAVFQDGPGSTAFITTGTLTSWPLAYQILGYDGTNLFYSVPDHGSSNGMNGSVGPAPYGFPALYNGAFVLTRTSGNVTLTAVAGNNTAGFFNYFTVGSQICITASGTFNGCFTVVTNSGDLYNDAVTWVQTGADATLSGATVSSPNTTITLYPAAEIIGTNNGTSGNAVLKPNNMALANGDVVIGTPAVTYEQRAYTAYFGQTSSGFNSGGIMAFNHGPAGPNYMFNATNQSTLPGSRMFQVIGNYQNDFTFTSRPTANGAILRVSPFEGDGTAPKQYNIHLESTSDYWAFNPSTHRYIVTALSDNEIAPGNCVQVTTGNHFVGSGGTCYAQLTGTTATITGSALSASCNSASVTVTGAVVGHTVTVSSTTGADVGGAFYLRASVTAANTVTVYVCGTGTPATLAYNVSTY